jgi:hypothetical protein
MFVELSTFCLIEKIEDAGLIEPVVLLAHELQISLAVGFERQMMVLNFGEVMNNLLLILVDQIIQLVPEVLVELPYAGEVRLNG